MEIWCSISEEDLTEKLSNNKINNFLCSSILENLLKFIEHHLINRNPEAEKEDPDGWHPYKSAFILLRNLSQFSKKIIVDFVFGLIKNHLNDENPKKRESVISAFGCILDSQHKDRMEQILESAVKSLVPMLTSETSASVRISICWTFKKIFQSSIENILQFRPDTIDMLLKSIIGYVNLENPKTNKKIINQLCESLDTLIQKEFYFYKNKNLTFQNSILSEFYKTLFINLLNICFDKNSKSLDSSNSESFKLAYGAFNALISLTIFSPENCREFLNVFFPNLIDALLSTFNIKNYENDEERFSQQDRICSLISTTIAYNKVDLNGEKADFLYDTIKKMFLERNNVFEGGILVCSSIAISQGNGFNKHLQDFLNFLNVSLNSIDNISLCRISINCLSDLIRSIGYGLDKYMDEFFKIIHDIVIVIIYEQLYIYINFDVLFLNYRMLTQIKVSSVAVLLFFLICFTTYQNMPTRISRKS